MSIVPAEKQHVGDYHLGAATGRSESSLAEAVAEVERLDGAALRRRWRSLVGSPLPPDLGRTLTLRVLAYKLQAQHLGDLDKASTRELLATTACDIDVSCDDGKTLPLSPASGRSAMGYLSLPKPRPLARPGTVLVREYAGVRHRVMVLDEGVAWNGKTYDSLSQVAFAITGTRCNGPRFFGLRDKADKDDRRPPDHMKQSARLSRRSTSPKQALAPAPARP